MFISESAHCVLSGRLLALAMAGLALGFLVSGLTETQARDQIRIVGSSTVFPFSAAVAERFGKSGRYKTPVVEATGTGGGIKLFCAGRGENTPDFTNASSRMKPSQLKQCMGNGVKHVTEIKLGYDGIVFANATSGQRADFTVRQIYLALAAEVPDGNGGLQPNPYQRWSDIASDLPPVRIEVLGPPPTSGTRAAFSELVLDKGAREFAFLNAMRKKNKKAFQKATYKIREDGAYIEAGENDNLIVQKLVRNPNAYGIFGFSFLDQNRDKVQGALINTVAPEFENIASGAYPVSRSLFFYVKNAHIGQIPGMMEYLKEFTKNSTWGADGYLADKGLIPLNAEEAKTYRQAAQTLPALTLSDLQ